jgi:excisionase family DNA binding protein
VASSTSPQPSTQYNRGSRRHPDKQVPPAFLGIPEAATYLGVAEKTVRRLISRGELPAYRLGSRVIKIRVTDLETVLTPLGGGV